MILNKILSIYDFVFQFLAKNRIEKKDLDLQYIHKHNIVVLMTGLLMWAYAFIAYCTISSLIPGIIGLLASIIHLSSPLLFRFTNKIHLISGIMLGAGVIHQGTFAFFTGGFSSHILIWYAIIPTLAGIITDNKGLTFWFIIVSLISLIFFSLDLYGFQFPRLITREGFLFSQLLLIFGWIFTSTVILFTFNNLINEKSKRLADERNKLDNLLRILVHDFSNSIHVLKSTSTILLNRGLKSDGNEKRDPTKFLTAIKKHSDFLSDTTSSIKAMYIMSNRNQDLLIQEIDLNKSLRLLLSILDNKVEQKQLSINYDYEKNKDIFVHATPHIFENQILQNILTNAIKFSHPGGKIDIETKIEDPTYLELTIKDYGIGMPSELLNSIFSPEREATRQGTAKEPGTGLGMYILKSFVDKLNFKIKVESQPDQGTAVTLLIPRVTELHNA